MTFDENASRSVNTLRILFDIDIGTLHTQWVNAGAGVWYVNTDGLYPEVDSSLLSGFTSFTYASIGAVVVDDVQLVQASTLLECSDNEGSFYWDGTSLYIHIIGGDSPYIHIITVGVVYGYSREGFTPDGSMVHYTSRLLSIPKVSKARDPLFYGKIQYEGGSAELNNADGYFDLFGETNDVYGNTARVTIGFDGLDISEYQRLFTGLTETIGVSETGLTVSFADRRKMLTKPITYACTGKNAVDAVQEILLDEYGIPYNSLYFNTALWEAARAKAYSVTLDMQKDEPAIDVIQKICESTFGMFQVDPSGKYAFRVIRPGDAATYTIPEYDIINNPTATYDPSEVITSTRIGYAKDWTTTGSAYTYLNDTSQQTTIYAKYKVYNEKTFDTYLPNLAAAQTFSDTILAYAGTIRPVMDIEVPIKYWEIDVGDFAEIEVDRANATWFGVRKCEVIGKTYNLDAGTITLTVRKYGGEISYRITTDGYMRYTTDGEVRKVGQ